MTSKKPSLMRIYALSTVISALLVIFVGYKAGLGALLLVLILAALEITFSVDNAVVNTRILEKMSYAWQQAFLTIGIVIAVFGVRVLLPLLIVSGLAGLSLGEVVNLALNNPEEYGHHLEEAHPVIAAFGGMFLMMIFLDFFLKDRKVKWVKTIERIFAKAGKLDNIAIILSSIILLTFSSFFPSEEHLDVLTAGFFGLLTYLIINSLDTLLHQAGVDKAITRGAQNTFKAGLIGFIYLNIVDASFSLDGVIGAFAITSQILIIAVGLGIGALYVRVLTIHMLRHGVLDEYRYLEHGAHYAIGILAILLFVSLKINVSEFVTGFAGLVVVATALAHSFYVRKKQRSLSTA